MKILIIEDEQKMASFISRGLKEEGYEVDVAYDGETGWDLLAADAYDLVVLDWMLPRMSGIDLCKKIRSLGHKVSILMVTAKDTVDDKIRGLDEGADDYITKPFHFDELLARVRALLRRPKEIREETVLKCGGIQMDLLARKVWVDAAEVSFSQKEFSLLEFLIRKKGEVVSRSQIAEQVWDLHFDPMSNTIDVYINFLRKKIDVNREKSYIETIRGAGYRIVE